MKPILKTNLTIYFIKCQQENSPLCTSYSCINLTRPPLSPLIPPSLALMINIKTEQQAAGHQGGSLRFYQSQAGSAHCLHHFCRFLRILVKVLIRND